MKIPVETLATLGGMNRLGFPLRSIENASKTATCTFFNKGQHGPAQCHGKETCAFQVSVIFGTNPASIIEAPTILMFIPSKMGKIMQLCTNPCLAY